MRMSALSVVIALGAFVSAAVFPIACTDEGEAISGTTEGASASAVAATAAATGSSGAGGTGGASTGSGMDGGLPDGALEQCLMQAMNDCSICACNSCLAELTTCEMDPGCVAIRMCAQLNMCTGAGCLGPCMAEINMYPMSIGAASALSTCVEMNCMMDCAPNLDAGDGG